MRFGHSLLGGQLDIGTGRSATSLVARQRFPNPKNDSPYVVSVLYIFFLSLLLSSVHCTLIIERSHYIRYLTCYLVDLPFMLAIPGVFLCYRVQSIYTSIPLYSSSDFVHFRRYFYRALQKFIAVHSEVLIKKVPSKLTSQTLKVQYSNHSMCPLSTNYSASEGKTLGKTEVCVSISYDINTRVVK